MEVEFRFRETTLIYLFHSIIKTVDTEKARPKKKRGSQLHMFAINRAILLICPSQPVYPDRAKPARPVSCRYFGKRRKKGRIYDEFVKKETKDTEKT
jgi:hypothetical protein